MNMRKFLHLFVTANLMVASQSTLAKSSKDLWILVVGPMCLAQFPRYADTEVGKIFLRGSDINDFLDRPFARCFRSHNWASVQLCADVMSLEKDQLKDLQPVHERHQDEIRAMTDAFSYFNAYVWLDPKSSAWPHKCPDVAK